MIQTHSSADMAQNPVLAEVKLTKKALSDFLQWSTTKYNDYMGYGNKKENVELVYKALLEGKHGDEIVFTIQCAAAEGQSRNRNWRTKGKGGDTYLINCQTLEIEAQWSKRHIKFKRP